MPQKHIALIGTLDTKGEEVFFMADIVRRRGFAPLVLDVGPLTPAGVPTDYTNRQIARLGGWRLADLIEAGQRDQIISVMGAGASKALSAQLQDGRLNGVIGIGGNQGTAIAAMAMRSLPLGFPKFLVSTVASGNMRPYVGHKDICVVFSVADLLGGPNAVSRSILTHAISAVIGMVEHGEPISIQRADRTVALSALGNTEAAAHRISELLQQKGYQVITFHASGAGGSAMEELIDAGVFCGLIDLTPHELAEEIVGEGAYVPVTPGRMEAAGRAGIPQVVSTGALEYVCFGPWESIPVRLRRRNVYMHNPYNANVKVTRSEMTQIGRVMARRLNPAKGPTVVLVPLKGWSVYGSSGGPLFDPIGNALLLKSLKRHLASKIHYEETNLHINEPLFADRCVDSLLQLLNRSENE